MHPDVRLAVRAVRDGDETWVRFTPEVVEDLGDDRDALLNAVERFESVDCPAGRAAADWLREDSLDNHGSTVTYLLLRDGRVEGFYALSSAQVRLSMRHRRQLVNDRGERYLDLRPLQPASLVAWIAKRNGAESTGRELLMHAFSTALQASELQASIALVLDPYDEETAEMWLRYEGVQFRRSAPAANEPGEVDGEPPPRRLWAPLQLHDVRFVSERTQSQERCPR